MIERIIQAQESIKEAEILHSEKISNNLVIAKLYHAMMYCLFALFEIRDIGSLTHADIIERFEKEYVQKGIFNGKFINIIQHAYDLTHECDCEHMPVPTDEDIERIMPLTKELIRNIEGYLKMSKEDLAKTTNDL